MMELLGQVKLVEHMPDIKADTENSDPNKISICHFAAPRILEAEPCEGS